MRLASYSPEVSRLRRVAKACAAGELSRTEYRQVRRKVILNMMGDAAMDEQTRPRFPEETTVRREFPARRRTDETTNRQSWIWFVLGFAVFMLMSIPALGFGQYIPKVSERSKSSLGGDRYHVNSVVWVPDASLDNIDQEQVDLLLADGLRAIHDEGTEGVHGFSGDELDQVGRFLNAIGVHDSQARLSVEDLRDLQALVAMQKERRGVTVQQLESLAGDLQAWVRAQGYPLAVAYVPSQTIEEEKVRIAVSVGVVSDVVIADSSTGLSETQSDSITRRMSELVGEPVRRAEVETRLNVLNRNPAYSVQTGFQPGQEVGDTELKMHVRREQDHGLVVQLDNHGLEAVGEERLSVTVGRSDMIRAGDRLNLALSSSLESDGQQFGGVDYGFLLSGDRMLRTSLAYADVSVAPGAAADGVLFESELVATRLFTRTARSEFVYQAGWHDVESDVGGGSSGQEAWFLGFGWEGHRLWDEYQLALTHSIGVRAGGVSGEDADVDDQFWRFDGSVLAWTPLAVPRISDDVRLVLRSRWQWTSDYLPATQRFSGTSPSVNSGLPIGTLLTDSAIEAGVELRVPQQIGARDGFWSVGLDTMFGESHANDTWQQLTTFSMGMEMKLIEDTAGSLTSVLRVGYPVSHKSNGVLDDDGAQFFWSLRYNR